MFVKEHLQAAVLIQQQTITETIDIQFLVGLLELCLAQLVALRIKQAQRRVMVAVFQDENLVSRKSDIGNKAVAACSIKVLRVEAPEQA